MWPIFLTIIYVTSLSVFHTEATVSITKARWFEPLKEEVDSRDNENQIAIEERKSPNQMVIIVGLL